MNKLKNSLHYVFACIVLFVVPACVIAGLWQEARSSESRSTEGVYSELLAAIDRNDVVTVERCLTRDMPVDMTGRTGMTPLMTAAQFGRVEIVKRLLAHGANLHASARGVGTPLSLAAGRGGPDMVRFLLEHGADPCAGNGQLTPLMSAAMTGDLATAEILIEAGADVNARDKFGNSALSLASMDGENAMSRRLLAAGAMEETESASLEKVACGGAL